MNGSCNSDFIALDPIYMNIPKKTLIYDEVDVTSIETVKASLAAAVREVEPPFSNFITEEVYQDVEYTLDGCNHAVKSQVKLVKCACTLAGIFTTYIYTHNSGSMKIVLETDEFIGLNQIVTHVPCGCVLPTPEDFEVEFKLESEDDTGIYAVSFVPTNPADEEGDGTYFVSVKVSARIIQKP